MYIYVHPCSIAYLEYGVGMTDATTLRNSDLLIHSLRERIPLLYQCIHHMECQMDSETKDGVMATSLKRGNEESS